MELPRRNAVSEAAVELDGGLRDSDDAIIKAHEKYADVNMRFFTLMKWAGELSVEENDQEDQAVRYKERSSTWAVRATIGASSVQVYLNEYTDTYSDDGVTEVFGNPSYSWGLKTADGEQQLGDVEMDGASGLFDEDINAQHPDVPFSIRVSDFEEFVSGLEDDLLAELGYEQQGASAEK